MKMEKSESDLKIFLEKSIDLFHQYLMELFRSSDIPPPVRYLRNRFIVSKDLFMSRRIGYFETGQNQSQSLRAFKEMESTYSALKPYLRMYSEQRKKLPNKISKNIPCLYGPAGNYLMERRIIFPIYSYNGTLLNIYGKSIDSDSPMPHVYSAYGMSWYNLDSKDIVKANTLIITEGLFDVFTFLQCGIKNVTALCAGRYNYSSLREYDIGLDFRRSDLMKELKRIKNLQTIYICFDNDYSTHKRGTYMAIILARVLLEQGYSVKILRLPKDQDPNSLFVSSTNDNSKRVQFFQEHFKDLIETAVDFVVEEAYLLLEKLDLNEVTDTEVRKIINSVANHYGKRSELNLKI